MQEKNLLQQSETIQNIMKSRVFLSSILLLLVTGSSINAEDFEDIDPTKGCHNPADIVFVLDESGSIWGPHFTKQLEFVEEFVNSFDVRSGKTHIGVLTFASDVRVIFQLGEHTTDEALKENIKAIEQMRGETFTDLALKEMRENLFLKARPGIPHIGIVITDGESNYPDRTAKQARLTHAAGLQMFAIGVGPSINKDELRAVASADDFVFEVDDYDALEKIRQMLAWKACQVTTVPPTTLPPPQMIQDCTGYKPLDLIWALSDAADEAGTRSAVDLVGDLADEMHLGAHRVQVGVTPRYCLKSQQSPPVRLADHDSVEGLRQTMGRRVEPAEAMSHAHLQYIRTQGIHKGGGARDEATKIAVLVLDSKHGGNLPRTLDEVDKCKQEGIRIIVIGVGDGVVEAELNQVASSPDDVIRVTSYDQLSQAKSNVLSRLCNGLINPIKKHRIYLKRYLSIYED